MPDSHIEIRARLASVLDVLEHEAAALTSFHDPRLVGVVQEMTRLQAEMVAALATLAPCRRTDTDASPFVGLLRVESVDWWWPSSQYMHGWALAARGLISDHYLPRSLRATATASSREFTPNA